MSHGLHACKRIYCTFPLCALQGFEKKYGFSRSSTSHISSWLIYWVLREAYISFEFIIPVVECGYTLGKLEELWNIIPWPTWWGEFIFDSLTNIFWSIIMCSHSSCFMCSTVFKCVGVASLTYFSHTSSCGCSSQKIFL